MEQERGVEHDWFFLEVEKILAGQNKRRVLRRLMQGTGRRRMATVFNLLHCKKLGLKTLFFSTKIKLFYAKDAFLTFQRRILLAADYIEVRYL